MIRRTSSSKMYHMLTVEAPITKVIHILMSAKENSPLYVAQALDKVKNVVPTAACPSRKNPMRCAGIYAKILFSRSLTFFKPIVPTICSRQSSTRNGPKNWWTLSPLTSLVPSYKYVAFYPMKIPPTQSLKIATKWLISHSEF